MVVVTQFAFALSLKIRQLSILDKSADFHHQTNHFHTAIQACFLFNFSQNLCREKECFPFAKYLFPVNCWSCSGSCIFSPEQFDSLPVYWKNFKNDSIDLILS